ncbi:PilN domain-containing protein [Clostridium sp. C8-1-8]|uniref:PilN domain-containing protein n=1 Tax=Clostridium sp. C8-1-8 TaxID=2698831 RepID=UPI00136B3E99|nr:PilN domain-containing protein [Clostridium sp. C8-1-8]
MNDFNFFAPYQGKQKQVVGKKIYVYTISAVVGVLILGSLIWNSISIFMLNRSIDKYQSSINSTKVQEKVKKAEEVNKKIEVLNKYDDGLTKINSAINSRDTISSTLLKDINSTLPKDVYFKSISVDGNSLSIQGVSKTRTAIGEVQHNMKSLDIIADAQIGNISGDDSDAGNYTFDLKCTLKDVDEK